MERRYLDKEGLLFYTQVIHNYLIEKIDEEIKKDVAKKIIADNPQIIAEINEKLANGELIPVSAMEQAKAEAIEAATKKCEELVSQYVQDYFKNEIDKVINENIDIEGLTESILNNPELQNKFVKKTGDSMSGNLSVNGHLSASGEVTGERFVTSSGVVFF